MTLTGDDLPEPGTGADQVVCGCGGELFKFVITPDQILAICGRCDARNAAWPRMAGTEGLPDPQPAAPWRDTLGGQGIPQVGAAWGSGPAVHQGGHGNVAGSGFSGGGASGAGRWPAPEDITVTGGPATASGSPGGGGGLATGPQHDAQWQAEQAEAIRKQMAEPPPLPAFSKEACNAYLEGGPYDGQFVALVAGTTDFHVTGVGHWRLTDRTREDRDVYEYVRPPAP